MRSFPGSALKPQLSAEPLGPFADSEKSKVPVRRIEGVVRLKAAAIVRHVKT